MTDTRRPAAARGRRTAPVEVWDRVRQDYLGGVSGPECCRRHGVGLTALRDRAAKGGWRRGDQAWTPPNRLDPEDEGRLLEAQVDGDLDRVELTDLSFVAWRRMMRAVMRGDAAEALRWRKVRLAMDEEEAELQRAMAQDEMLLFHARSPVDPDASHDPHASNASDASDASDGSFDVRD